MPRQIFIGPPRSNHFSLFPCHLFPKICVRPVASPFPLGVLKTGWRKGLPLSPLFLLYLWQAGQSSPPRIWLPAPSLTGVFIDDRMFQPTNGLHNAPAQFPIYFPSFPPHYLPLFLSSRSPSSPFTSPLLPTSSSPFFYIPSHIAIQTLPI